MCVVGQFEICFHEGYLCRGHWSVISFITHKLIFVYFNSHGDIFYNIYMKSVTRTKYMDDDGKGVKPKQTFTKEYRGRMRAYGRNQ